MPPQEAERRERRERRIRLSLIDPDPDQPRKTFPAAELRNLADSIEQDRLQQRPAVRVHPTKPGRYMLIYGERRFRALQSLGREEEVFDVLGGEIDVLDEQTIENCNRQNLNYMDEAKLIARHRARNRSFEDIARRMGQSIGTIRNRMKLLELPVEIQMMVAQGKLPQVSALNLSQYKGAAGDQIRLAYDLIAGRDATDLHVAAIERLRHPGSGHARGGPVNNPQRTFSRVLEIGYRTKSEDHTVVLWAALTEEQRLAMFGRLPMTAQEGFRDSLKKQIALRTCILESLVASPEKPRDETTKSAPPRAKAADSPVSPCSPREVEMVLTAICPNGKVNLGRKYLAGFCKLPEKDTERRVIAALRVARDQWRAPAKDGEMGEASLATRIAHLRHDTGSAQFGDFVAMLQHKDHSADPIRVGLSLQ